MKKLLTALTFYFCVILLHAQGTLLDSKALDDAKTYESLEEALKEPLKVYKLDLSRKELKQLPAEIGQLKNLQVLNCSDNQLKSLAGIEKLTSLTELSCRDNQLKSLAGIEKLTSLTELSCSNNQLKSLAGIEQLASLTYLICDSNQLTSLSEIEQLTSLRVLYCSYNQLTTLIGIKKLTSLASLYCADNQLTNLVGIEKLTSLTKLDCSYNQLISLSGVEQLTSLTKLECFANQLTSLSGIEKLTSLTKLYCSENKLITLPKEIGKLEKLSGVDFQNQKQNDFSKVDLKKMYELYRAVYRVQKREKDSLTIYQNDYTKLANEKKLSYIWTLCRKFEGYTSDFDRYKDGQANSIKTNNNEIQMAMEEGILEGKASLGRLMQKMLLTAQPLVISNKDIAAKAVFAYFMGVAHEVQNNWKEATASYQEWLNLRKKEGDKTKIRIALNNNIRFTLRAYQYYQENPSTKVDYSYTTAEEFADEYYKNAQGQTYTTTNRVEVKDTKIIEKELTQVGKEISIPTPADSVALKEGLELEVVMPRKTALDSLDYEADADSLMHVYDKGETLESIAKMYSVSLQELLKENPSIKTNKDLKEGQEIKIKQIKTHIAKEGENWKAINSKYKINIIRLIPFMNKVKKEQYNFTSENYGYQPPVANTKYIIYKEKNNSTNDNNNIFQNNLVKHITKKGETLKSIAQIYSLEYAKARVRFNKTLEHIVQAGENLPIIAKIYGVSVEDIIRYNPIYKDIEQQESFEFIGIKVLISIFKNTTPVSETILNLTEKYLKIIQNYNANTKLNKILIPLEALEEISLKKGLLYLYHRNKVDKSTYYLSKSSKPSKKGTETFMKQFKHTLNISNDNTRSKNYYEITSALNEEGFWKEAIDIQWFDCAKSEYAGKSPNLFWYIERIETSDRELKLDYEEQSLYRLQKFIDDSTNRKDALLVVFKGYQGMCLSFLRADNIPKSKEYFDKADILAVDAATKQNLYYDVSNNISLNAQTDDFLEYVMGKWINLSIKQNKFDYAIYLYYKLSKYYSKTYDFLRIYKDLLLKSRALNIYSQHAKKAYSFINTRIKNLIDILPPSFDYNKNEYSAEEKLKIPIILDYADDSKKSIIFLEQWLSDELTEPNDEDRKKLITLLQNSIEVLKRYQTSSSILQKLETFLPKQTK